MQERKIVEKEIMEQLEKIASFFNYDFLFENLYDVCVAQILIRDSDGSIISTVLSIELKLSKDCNSGVFIFYHSKGEFKRMEFNFNNIQSYLEVIEFIQNRLNQKNQKSKSSD